MVAADVPEQDAELPETPQPDENNRNVISDAMKNLARAFTTNTEGGKRDWIPWRVDAEAAAKIGHGGLGALLSENLDGDIGDDEQAKKTISSVDEFKRGPHNQGIYSWAATNSDGGDNARSLKYSARKEKSGAPYLNIRFLNPDIEADKRLIQESLQKIPTVLQKKPDHQTYEEKVCAQLRVIIAKGAPVQTKPPATPRKPPKTNPSKRKHPLTEQENSPDALRIKAAGDLLLRDPKAADDLINLGAFLTTHVDMSGILTSKNQNLTPKSRAAKGTVKAGQVLMALKGFKDQQGRPDSLLLRSDGESLTGKRSVPFGNQAYIGDFAFAMRENPAVGTIIDASSGKHTLIEPRAVSVFCYVKYSLKKIVSYYAGEHAFLDSPLTQGICQVLGINTAIVKTWDLASVRSIIRPFLEEYNIDDLCEDPAVKSRLLTAE